MRSLSKVCVTFAFSRSLTIGDQIALLKGATFEVMQIRFNMVFNAKRGIWECGHITYCIDDAVRGKIPSTNEPKHAFIRRIALSVAEWKCTRHTDCKSPWSILIFKVDCVFWLGTNILGYMEEVEHKAHQLAGSCKAVKTSLKTCGYPRWTFEKTSHSKKTTNTGREEEAHNTTQKFRGILNIYHVPSHPIGFRSSNTLRQKRIHPKDTTPPQTQKSILANAIQDSEPCDNLYSGETKPPLNTRMSVTEGL